MTRVLAQRIVLVVVAVVAIAWLAVSYGNARLIRHAQVVAADAHASPAQIRTAVADARSARTLDPSRAESLSYAAVLELRARHFQSARTLLERVVRLEPDGAEAWVLLAELTKGTNPARSAQARAQLQRLDPMGARALR